MKNIELRHKKEYTLMIARTGRMWRAHKKRAQKKHKAIDYTLEDLRGIVKVALTTSRCPYCKGELTAKTFSLDHGTPVKRGGTFSIENLVVCCKPCNLEKGVLTVEEFMAYLAWKSTLPTEMAADIQRRLRAATAFAFRC